MFLRTLAALVCSATDAVDALADVVLGRAQAGGPARVAAIAAAGVGPGVVGVAGPVIHVVASWQAKDVVWDVQVAGEGGVLRA